MEPAALYDVGAPCLERPISLKSLATEEMSKRPKINGPVKVASGPWGLEEEWWAEKPLERDYWDVELQSGGLYRLYRDRKTGDWFVDGIYD
jgi:protein ImuB